MTVTPQEVRYRRVINRIAIAMLIFFACLTVMGIMASLLLPLLISFLPPIAGDVVYECLYGVLYALMFLVPSFCLLKMLQHEGYPPLELRLMLPRGTVMYIFIGVAAVLAAARLNAVIVDLLTFLLPELDAGVQPAAPPTTNYQLVLMVITTAVVPAFVEELLFRGVVLRALLPYGRTTAVVASALLFGLMHGNASQLLYATAAGLVFGYIFVHTGSLWCPILIHLCNNLFAVITSVLYERLQPLTAYLTATAIELAVLAIGIAAALFLLLSQRRDRRRVLREGAFERELPPDPEYAVVCLPARRRVRLFFSVLMIVFIVLCVLQMLFGLLVS
ncbi:MAG: CPBP family intramembrane metalloprotease [Clostridia bacterium]|nr:CPBP family intramembrane metalloprotease [Clostridia bacterium]